MALGHLNHDGLLPQTRLCGGSHVRDSRHRGASDGRALRGIMHDEVAGHADHALERALLQEYRIVEQDDVADFDVSPPPVSPRVDRVGEPAGYGWVHGRAVAGLFRRKRKMGQHLRDIREGMGFWGLFVARESLYSESFEHLQRM